MHGMWPNPLAISLVPWQAFSYSKTGMLSSVNDKNHALLLVSEIFMFLLFQIFGPHLAMLMTYYWICTLLMSLRGPYGMPGWTLIRCKTNTHHTINLVQRVKTENSWFHEVRTLFSWIRALVSWICALPTGTYGFCSAGQKVAAHPQSAICVLGKEAGGGRIEGQRAVTHYIILAVSIAKECWEIYCFNWTYFVLICWKIFIRKKTLDRHPTIFAYVFIVNWRNTTIF